MTTALNGINRDGLEVAGTEPGAASQLKYPLRVSFENLVQMFVGIHRQNSKACRT